jgi:hypothetical protein
MRGATATAAGVALTLAVLQDEASTVSGAVLGDKVTSLPGYAGALPSDHYSGYMPVGELSGSRGHLHYWFIESEVSGYLLPLLHFITAPLLHHTTAPTNHCSTTVPLHHSSRLVDA